MALVLGIDPSAKKIAVVGFETVTLTIYAQAHVLYKTGKQTNETIAKALDAMDDVIDHCKHGAKPGEFHAFIESGIIYGARGRSQSTIKQAYVSGIIRGTLVRAGYTVSDVPVATWKARVIGDGHADKQKVERVVKAKWPKMHRLVGHDGDLTDAAAICQYGVQTLATA